MAAMRGNLWTRIGIGVAGVGVLGWLFLRTLQDTRSMPYTVRASDTQSWKLIVTSDDRTGALAGLQPPSAFTADLFKQVFARNMESLTSPADPIVPVVSHIEAASGLQVAVVAAVRDAGLESASLVPQCLAVRRSEPPASHDYYFVMFEPASFHAARQRAVETAGARAGFDPTALIPTLVIATSDPAVPNVLPFEPDADRDCVAPVTLK